MDLTVSAESDLVGTPSRAGRSWKGESSNRYNFFLHPLVKHAIFSHVFSPYSSTLLNSSRNADTSSIIAAARQRHPRPSPRQRGPHRHPPRRENMLLPSMRRTRPKHNTGDSMRPRLPPRLSDQAPRAQLRLSALPHKPERTPTPRPGISFRLVLLQRLQLRRRRLPLRTPRGARRSQGNPLQTAQEGESPQDQEAKGRAQSSRC